MIRHAAVAYSRLYRRVKLSTRCDLPGLGRALRTIHKPFDFQVGHASFRFEPALAVNYGMMLSGHPNETETHLFFDRIVGRLPGLTVVDVGANIGEMAVVWADRAKVIAFEPHPACAEVIRQSAALSGVRVDVRKKALLSRAGHGEMAAGNEYSSAVIAGSGPVEISTLDAEIAPVSPSLLLIDTEGGELEVMKGGKRFIRGARPIVVFEHHAGTQKRFGLAEVQTELVGYDLYRLRKDGCLDQRWDLVRWNVVAIPQEMDIADLVRSGDGERDPPRFLQRLIWR